MSDAPERCGFFGIGGVTSETDLRQDVHDAAVAERAIWFTAGSAVGDLDDPHFGHLVRYWLAIQNTIRPPTLTHLYSQALSPTIVYGTLLNRNATEAAATTAASTVAANLLVGAPPVGGPANVQQRVADALLAAWKTRLPADPWQWSGAFISNVIRGAAVKRGLEAESGGAHVGRNVLIKVGLGHRDYVKEAHRRRFVATPPVTGTYQAFRPGEEPVEVGDILVGDRLAGNPGDVVAFDDIPSISDTHPMHGDIVVAVTSTDAEAIGGNIGYRDPNPNDACDQLGSLDPFNVRRRRYPLTAGGKLDVDPDQRFMQEDNSGHLPPVPLVCPVATNGFHQRSMGRMFVVLKPVEECRPA